MTVEIQTQWTSTAPLPDEKHLQDLWKARIASRNRHYAQLAALREWHKAHRPSVSKVLGLSEEEISLVCQDSAALAAHMWAEVRRELVIPPEYCWYLEAESAIILQNIAAAQLAAALATEGPPWSGTITESAGAGFWHDSNVGADVESPNAILYHGGPDRLGLRAETLSGHDEEYYAEIHAYMKFEMTPPSWGSLAIDARPWLHGFYHAFADGAGRYDDSAVEVELDAWVDLHQNFWRTRVYENFLDLFEMGPSVQSDRIDTQALLQPVFNVGEGDAVTIRVGVRLCCETRGWFSAPLSAHAVLDFLEGEANYVSVPCVQWTLTQ